MNKKFIKVLCSVTFSCMICTIYLAIVSAAPINNSKFKSNEINTSVDGSNKSERIPSTNSEPLGLNKKNTNSSKYSFSDLNNLSNKEILDLTSKIKWSDISDLFQYNNDSYTFYSNRERMEALINGLYEKASTYTSTDDKGIDTLVEILRSGFYLGYYNDSLKYLNDRSFQDKCIPAMLAIENNKNFKLGEKGQDTVINALGKLIGNASCNSEVVNKTVPIIEQYYREMNTYPKDKLKGDAVYNFMKEISYDISEYSYNNNILDGKNTPWTGKIDSFINAISKFAKISDVTENNDWIINNGIYYTSKLSMYHSNPSIPHSIIDNCLKLLPAYSEQFYIAVERIKDDFNGKDSKGNIININKLIENGKNHYLPKTYTFDNGKMIIKTGDKVDESKVQKLYWASKEVKSQFHRVIGNDVPLETGNADDVLTMVIYNNPKEYKLNRVLYGFSVENGGIYIENIGTFFTYERTPEESIYSLEELFRHEFTHYLQGRYLVPGLFGQGDFYKGNSGRITWFEEGSAEFFAGATRTSILPRKSIVRELSQNPKERFSTDKILHSKYDDGWDFYKYGYAFSDYMYNNNKKLFNDLVSTIKNNNVKGYENLIENASKNSNLNKNYQDHMQKLVDNYDNYTIPLVSDDYMKKYNNRSLNEIKSDIESTMNLTNSQITKETSQYFDTYTLKANYTLDLNKGEINNWINMNNKVNESLEKLNKLEWGGYKTVTAYFSNPKVNSYNQVEYNVVFHGLLAHNKNFNEAPTIKLDFPKEGNANEKINFSSEGSSDDGKIVSYTWDFGDNETSFEKNPTHVYKTPGTYTVKLIITDDKGIKSEKSASINIKKILTGNTVSEKESNDDYITANPVYSKDLVSGSISSSEDRDIFYFNVTKPSDITINVEKINKDKSEFTWLLFSEEDKINYITYPNKRLENLFYSTVKIDKPGKYYLAIYNVNGNKSDYRFNIEGAISTSPEDNINIDKDESSIYEKEDNNSFGKANKVCKNQSVIATLDIDDSRDTYYFDALTAGDIEVTMENTDNNSNEFNWLAYNSDNTKNYIGYPTKRECNKIIGKFKVDKPGRYYIITYKISSNKINYKLNIKGNIETALVNNEIHEKENNDSFETANKIMLNNTVLGNLNCKDVRDIYSFDIKETKDLDINLNNLNNLGLAWNLYKESDLNNYIAYGLVSGNTIKGKYTAKPGKYYLYVYTYSGDNGDYSLTIK